MKVGQKIKELRTNKNWTLKNIKNKTGISISFLSDIERGVSTPSLKKLKKIADALNVTTYSLLDDKYQSKPSETKIPVINQKFISLPLLSKKNITTYRPIIKKLEPSNKLFFINIKDNSMKNCGILYSSKALIKKKEI